MQLSGFTDLALRIVMRLAVLDEGELASTARLSEELAVSPAHAAKVVTALHKLGVVEARRGRSGGLVLAADAGAISVGHVVRSLGGDREVVECEGKNPCPLRGGCRLRSALGRAQEAFYAALDPVTIADVVSSPTGPLLLSLGPTNPR
jgi:Rrf2 family nitric oxide-sensitive transcriptional repressor